MKLTKEYLKECLEEVAPLVEEISELKCDLNNLNLILFPKKEFQLAIPGGIASYRSKNNFSIINRSLGNREFTKITLGHELVHNAQDCSFPGLYANRKIFNSNWEKDHSTESPLTRLIEGDATLIEQKLSEKYFKKSKINFLGIPLISHNWLRHPDYMSWAEILKRNFNNGKDRKSINELYIENPRDLVKIFGN